jgi:hypothetical protein
MSHYPSQEKRWIKAQQLETLRHTVRDKSQVNKCFISITSWLFYAMAPFQLNSNRELKAN